MTEGSKWPKTAITYTLTSPSSKLAIDDQKSVLQQAFNRWAEVTPLTFSYTNNQQGADINIRFASCEYLLNTVTISLAAWLTFEKLSCTFENIREGATPPSEHPWSRGPHQVRLAVTFSS